jgi:hypothetical protein
MRHLTCKELEMWLSVPAIDGGPCDEHDEQPVGQIKRPPVIYPQIGLAG